MGRGDALVPRAVRLRRARAVLVASCGALLGLGVLVPESWPVAHEVYALLLPSGISRKP